MNLDTNGRITENPNLGFSPNNPAMNMNPIFCNGCKRNRIPDYYKGRIPGKTYKLCSDCRLRFNNRRRPQANQNETNDENHISPLGT